VSTLEAVQRLPHLCHSLLQGFVGRSVHLATQAGSNSTIRWV
jgi:hypothetical protein